MQMMIGAIIIWIRLTNMVPSGSSLTAKSGAAKPRMMPANTATTTMMWSQCVRSRLFSVLSETVDPP